MVDWIVKSTGRAFYNHPILAPVLCVQAAPLRLGLHLHALRVAQEEKSIFYANGSGVGVITRVFSPQSRLSYPGEKAFHSISRCKETATTTFDPRALSAETEAPQPLANT